MRLRLRGVALVIRTWNLFHGKTHPPGRRAYLKQMIELVTRDQPDVVCLQELPVWSLPHLSAWSGMHAVSAVARRPLLRRGAKAVTDVHNGRLRSAFTGEADAILSTRPASDLGVTVVGEKKLRRIAHTVELDGVTVVNFHIDGDPEQLERVLAIPGDRAVVAGDTNLRAREADGFSPPLAGSIDQIYVRGLAVLEPPHAWPVERRTLDGRVLSDHAPVEAAVE
jgi:endonuclease/exonuclease/phosphatase family metal-dependent hydrolase